MFHVVLLIVVTALLVTFVFLQWWAFENVAVPRDQTLDEDKNF